MGEMTTHEDTGTTLRVRALATETLDLPVRVHLVVLEDGHLDFFPLVLDLFRGLEEGRIPSAQCMTKRTEWARTLYVFFLRFLAPPRRRRTRWRVDSF